jgi:hypothetical protein
MDSSKDKLFPSQEQSIKKPIRLQRITFNSKGKRSKVPATLLRFMQHICGTRGCVKIPGKAPCMIKIVAFFEAYQYEEFAASLMSRFVK